jgi:hypothetical protein
MCGRLLVEIGDRRWGGGRGGSGDDGDVGNMRQFGVGLVIILELRYDDWRHTEFECVLG